MQAFLWFFPWRALKCESVCGFVCLFVPSRGPGVSQPPWLKKVITERLHLGWDWGGAFPGEARKMVSEIRRKSKRIKGCRHPPIFEKSADVSSGLLGAVEN